MGLRDAGFLYLERPEASLHIGCIAVLDRRVSAEALCQRLLARLPRMPRYAQRARVVPFDAGHPVWEDDPSFDVSHHVRAWSIPTPGGDAELAELSANLFELPLSRERPLWEMHVLDGLDGGRTAVLQKVHHCMVDGMAGAQLLEVLLDEAPSDYDADPLPRLPEPSRGSARRLGDAISEGARAPWSLAARALEAAVRPERARSALAELRDAAFQAVRLATTQVPELPWNGPIGPRRRLCFQTLPMEGVSRVRSMRGGTVNDVVLSVLAGGLHHYLASIGIPPHRLELTAMVPVSLRSPDEARALGNRISAMLVPLPVDVAQPLARLQATRTITERLKETRAWAGIDALLAQLEAVPVPMLALGGRRLRHVRIANLVCTNVPGPRATRYLGSARVEALHPVVPITHGLGLGVAVFSYDGQLHVGINADAESVPDPEKLHLGIAEAWAELMAAA